MQENSLFILSIVGSSDSGKTTLILKLLPELRKKGYRVAVAKHCPRGFDLDIEGKDSWRFSQAGAKGVFLSSSDAEAVMRPISDSGNIKERMEYYFSDFDILLMEGYGDQPGIQKIQIMRKEIGGELLSSDEIIAYISNFDLNTDKPEYKPEDISGVVSFLENLIRNKREKK